jgi:N-acetylglucosaminyldiphosphoundecaprenol N-acetyl-beta-D-mannosaminyltransferase
MPESRTILGVRVDATSYADATQRVMDWAQRGESCYVCLGAVNNIMVARDSAEYRTVMDEAALVTSDGMPLVWILRRLGVPHATRVYGPDLMPRVMEMAEAAGLPIGFYGGTEPVLRRLLQFVNHNFPALQVSYLSAPPFRQLTSEEDEETITAINNAGVRILFVGLGSPKQDRWMYAHRHRIHAVMLGVGAAFDFLAGVKTQAPRWMQRSGLEWLFRLLTEPRRLGRRYLRQNPKFAVLALAQLLRTSFHEHSRPAGTRR